MICRCWPGGDSADVAGLAPSGYRPEMKLTGTIHRNDLEGGHWTLKTGGGDVYQLVGAIGTPKDGMKAEVDGSVDKAAMGIGMTGPIFMVKKLTAL